MPEGKTSQRKEFPMAKAGTIKINKVVLDYNPSIKEKSLSLYLHKQMTK